MKSQKRISVVFDSKNGFQVSEETVVISLMCQFFKKSGYLDSAVTTGKHRAHEIGWDTALQTSKNEETNRMPFPQNFATEFQFPQNFGIINDILKNFKILRNDPETKHIFPLPAPLISFKGAHLSLTTNQESKCKRTRCKTCPFISNTLTLFPAFNFIEIAPWSLLHISLYVSEQGEKQKRWPRLNW